MYTRHLQLANYGPINRLDIELPFVNDQPRPLVLVGGNGSGKSIVLSHIVNGLITAKGLAFPDSSEVKQGKVYKLRSSEYIKSGQEYYYSRVDFERGYTISEIRTRQTKDQYTDIPNGVAGTPAQELWDQMDRSSNDYYQSTTSSHFGLDTRIREIFKQSCVLYLPANRYEEPAWLNEQNLTAQARHTELERLVGRTSRTVITLSPLYDNQNWLFDVIFDRSVFELQTSQINLPINQIQTLVPLPLFLGFSGDSENIYKAVLDIIRLVVNNPDARFGIGRRHNRVVSIESNSGQLVPNIFQLSSGETSLLNLCLSILRDFDLSERSLSSISDIRGIVVIDEVDLHLHAMQQYEVLPSLLSMFPKVQFIVTTHSPLFVLGMQRSLGDEGFALYRLPDGMRIRPEEFDEFGNAYRVFTETQRYARDVNQIIEDTGRPLLFVEGDSDCKYIRCAAVLLDKTPLLDRVELRSGGGAARLSTLCKSLKRLSTDIIPQPVIALFDSDTNKAPLDSERLFVRTIPFQIDNPVKKGIENLFDKQTLQEAREHSVTFIDIREEHSKTVRGHREKVPEEWTVNDNEKTNLCNWICGQRVPEYFIRFESIFSLIEEVLDKVGPD